MVKYFVCIGLNAKLPKSQSPAIAIVLGVPDVDRLFGHWAGLFLAIWLSATPCNTRFSAEQIQKTGRNLLL